MLSTFSLEYVASVLITVAVVMFSAIVHEVAHGYVAYRCGDPTAKEAGRLTLDPRAHLDGFGSIVLPIILALAGGVIVGFAKPVPYNPRRLRNPRRDELLVALAGPASNILQALLGTVLLKVSWEWGTFFITGYGTAYTVFYWVVQVLTTYIYVNLVLAFFNLVPLPPLDGSKVILYFLKGEARRRFYEISRYSMAILLVLIILVPMVTGLDPLGAYLDLTAGNLYYALLSVI